MTDYLIKEDVFMALTGDITDCTIEEFIARLRGKLSKLPSIGKDINVTTDDDCISRQAVHDLIAELLSDYLHDEDREKIEELDVKIEDLSSVTPKEKTGKWINDWEMGMSECSICGETYLWEDYKGTENFHYCPNCGARMVRE